MKSFLTLLLLLIVGHFSRAQAPTFAWASQPQSNGICYGTSIALDSMGNSYVTGQFTGIATFGSTSLSSSGEFDVYIAKYDASGNVLWAKQVGGAESEGGMTIAVDGSGNSYLTGFFEGVATFGSTTLSTNGATDYNIFIAKFDSSGNILWAKQAGGTGPRDFGIGIAVDNLGNSYVTGYITGSATFDSQTLTVIGMFNDAFIAKYDAAGNLIWVKQAGGPFDDAAYKVVVDGSGNSYVTGSFSTSVTFDSITLISSGYRDDIFIVKHNALGKVLWAKQIGGDSSEARGVIAVDISGNSYLTGSFRANITLDSITLINSSSNYQIFIAKLDTSGNVLWAKQAGGTQEVYGSNIAVDGSGNSYITGGFKGIATFDSTTLSSNGYKDLFVAKYDASGNMLWIKSAGGTNDDYGQGIAVDGSGNIYVMGECQGPVNFDSITLNNGNGMFLAKLHAARLGAPDNTPSGAAFLTLEAYPNPFDQELTLNLDSRSFAPIQLMITDVLGRVLESRQAAAGEWKINISHLKPGFYWLLAQQDGMRRQVKVLKK